MPDLNMPQQPRQGFMPRMAAMMAQPVDAVAAGIMKSQSKRAEAALGKDAPANTDNLPVNTKTVQDIVEVLQKYKAGKASLDERIVEEERWYRLRHWDVIRNKKATQKLRSDELRPEPTSAWMFNSIANKHADLMDNYPEPNVLPRQRDDEADAKTLSHILPVIFERNNYERTYDEAGWYKLKHGVSAKGVFWNTTLEDGLGDIDLHMLDILNIFWEPGITDLQASRNFFITSMMDNDLLEQKYPDLRDKLKGSKIITPKQYVHDDTIDTTDKSVVVDWYYKKQTPEGKTILHLCKFVGDTVLFASENEPEKYPNGFYDHGKYPVVLDVLFPLSGTCVGFGYIALMMSPQLYIDKLDQAILENSLMAAKPRYMAKKDLSGINMDEFLDWSKPVVFYEGDKDNIFPMEMPSLPSSAINVRQMKVDELKETSSNRDVSQGSSSGGVTAAAAIAALQEAGNKTSRDMIGRSYRAYAEENYLAIENVRQFYDIARSFRIVGQDGHAQFIDYSNANIRGVAMPPAYAGQEMQPGYVAAQRKPIFDIVVKPQKRSPYSKMAQNELAKELYQLGFFNPQMADQSLAALDLMEFDGIEMVREKVQQGQTLMNQLIMMQQQMQKMATIIYSLTGQDVLGVGLGAQGADGAAPKTPAAPQPDDGGKSMGSARTDAEKANMTAYGQRLAARAAPDMNAS